MALDTCFATGAEQRRSLPADELIPDPFFTSTHAITIDAPPERVWPWIAQMGGGRAGWYSWDIVDNGGVSSAGDVVPELQTVVAGDVMPALPGATDAFVVAAVEPDHDLVLTAPDGKGGNAVAWEHFLEPLGDGRTRLIVRARASSQWVDLARATPPDGHPRVFIERAYGVLARLPRPLLVAIARFGHRIMEVRHLRGIARRSAALQHERVRLQARERTEIIRKALLACGLASSLLYALMIWTIRYEGYSVLSQVPSELTAIGAPTQPLWARLGAIYTVLFAAFGCGIWLSAGDRRAVRILAGSILLFASLGLLWPFAPMHQRAVLATGGGTLGDTLHVVLGAVTVFLMFVAIAYGAAAFGRRFRLYSIASIVVLLAFGGLTFLEAPRVQANLPTPWVGLWERINISVFLLWTAVLSAKLVRDGRHHSKAETERPVMTQSSPFTSPRAEASFRAAYDNALKLWPVPYQELDIPTRFGMTHVITAGPESAPPLVLLHGYMATSVMWGPNIADFSREHRVYAIDVMGQPSRSVPDEPIRDASDYIAWLSATLDGLHLTRVSLLGMSFGGRTALQYAAAAPERVLCLALLSPGGLLQMVKQFSVRGMLMAFFPSRFTVNSFMRWAGIAGPGVAPVLELMYLGVRYFRIPGETLRANADAVNPLSDSDLRNLRMPVLLLFGEHEVIYDGAKALARARRLIPDFVGGLVPDCRHDMCFSQATIVNARVTEFLRTRGGKGASTPERSAA